MNVGANRERALEIAQRNADRTGEPRYVHWYNGVWWTGRDRPADADLVTEVLPRKKEDA
jgi:hypothetical protein